MSVNVCLTVIFYEPLSTTLRDEEIDASRAINKKNLSGRKIWIYPLGHKNQGEGWKLPTNRGKCLRVPWVVPSQEGIRSNIRGADTFRFLCSGVLVIHVSFPRAQQFSDFCVLHRNAWIQPKLHEAESTAVVPGTLYFHQIRRSSPREPKFGTNLLHQYFHLCFKKHFKVVDFKLSLNFSSYCGKKA